MRMFCYGTLKRDGVAHYLMKNSVFLRVITTHPRYCMYRIACFPGMVVGEETGGVQGELFEVDASVVKSLDRYEGVPGLFRRELIDLSDGSQAWSYLYARSFDERNKITSGVWT